MGNNHSTETTGRRHSLVREEFMFPDLDFELDSDYEVYYVEVELKPLPSHVHETTHVCIDDYTQEILPCDGNCVCACASTGKTDKWRPQNESDTGTMCRHLQSHSDKDFCFEWDVYTEEPCPLDAEQNERDAPNIANLRNVNFNENKAVTDFEGMCTQNCSDLYTPLEQDVAQGSVSGKNGMERRVSQCKRETQSETANPQNIRKDTQSRTDVFSIRTSEKNSSLTKEQRGVPDCGPITAPVWTDRRLSTITSRTRSNSIATETEASQDQTSRFSDGVHARRKSCSIPVPHTMARHLNPRLNSKKRKFSLKDEPGWIPNPLDSDSDSSDFEDSGIFSDCTGSPSLSSSPTNPVTVTPKTTTKTRALPTQRRRYNSEPMSGTSMSSSCPTQFDTAAASPLNSSQLESAATKPRTRRGSTWRFLRLSVKANKPEKADDPVRAEYPSPDEEDFSEQLRWLAMSDSQLSQDAESSSEQAEDVNSSESSANTCTSCTESAGVKDPQSSDEVASQRVSLFDGELELDWLCEPEWNNLELELFWSVLRPHLEHLLQPEDSELLPDACGAVCHMDAADPKMLDRCLLHVQWHIWRGSYRQAVADFQAIRRHFLCCAQSQLIESSTRDDVENLRLLFQRKRPSRFRLWI